MLREWDAYPGTKVSRPEPWVEPAEPPVQATHRVARSAQAKLTSTQGSLFFDGDGDEAPRPGAYGVRKP